MVGRALEAPVMFFCVCSGVALQWILLRETGLQFLIYHRIGLNY